MGLYASQTQSMVDEIKKTFKKRVKEHEWIDDKTTKYVFAKVSQSFLYYMKDLFLRNLLRLPVYWVGQMELGWIYDSKA